MTYTADFKVWFPDGRIEILDTKGFVTEAFNLKRKFFEYINPDIKFYIVEMENGEWVKRVSKKRKKSKKK
jgi:hypothetical protein